MLPCRFDTPDYSFWMASLIRPYLPTYTVHPFELAVEVSDAAVGS